MHLGLPSPRHMQEVGCSTLDEKLFQSSHNKITDRRTHKHNGGSEALRAGFSKKAECRWVIDIVLQSDLQQSV